MSVNDKLAMFQNNTDINGDLTFFELLDKVRNDKILYQCVIENKNDEEINSLKLGKYQTAMIILSKYGQNIISDYTKLILNNIPKLENNSDILKVKKWLLNIVILLYTYSSKLSHNDFFLLHGITSSYAMIQILYYLDNKNRNNLILYYINTLIGTYVVQGQPKVDINLSIIDEEKDDIKDNDSLNIYHKIHSFLPNKDTKTFLDEHVYKLIHIILECYQQNIISPKCALDALSKIKNPFHFASINTNYIRV
mmetsp:Transcript_76448/g.93897  ORF Transcript_76448/g.93897 Transcript_76448/m.93897 type:complete len:252 (+) Transcript_76448:328-1083(+)